MLEALSVDNAAEQCGRGQMLRFFGITAESEQRMKCLYSVEPRRPIP